MSRPIEFRSLNLRTKQWEYFSLSSKGDIGLPLVCFDKDLWVHRTISNFQYTALTEWTGLFDRNKVKIFEGDIVQVDEHYDGDSRIYSYRDNIIFDEGIFDGKRSFGYGLSTLCLNNMCEVIGNIVDTPELVEAA